MRHEELKDMIPAGAAGALEAEEQRALDAHLLVCDKCRREHDASVETAALAALAIEPVAPPAAVRSRVLSAIDAAGAPDAPNVARMRPRQTPAWWLAAAAVLIALGVGGWAWSVARQKQRNIDALRQQLLAAQRETIEGSQREAELQRKLEALTSGDAMSIRMVGQESAPQASANVFMNPRTRSALVFFNHLPPTGPERSYQLWVIRADQPAPQSAGTFEVGSEGKATLTVENLPVNTEIKAFALTLEPRGGVNAPTGPKYLIGS